MIGTLQRHENFPSQHVPARHVDVWLPPAATRPGADKLACPVLYMHDGQNLFDPALAYGGETWGVAEALARLAGEGVVPPTIIVGIWNQPQRWREYMPQRPLATPAGAQRLAQMGPEFAGGPLADAYLRFLVTELKPFIDRQYPTRPGREQTFVMGSSMGGLISLYALCEYPAVFAGAGCLSTHWPAGEGIVLDYLAENLPRPGQHKIYFDYGTATLDALYEPYQQRADALLRAAGYSEGQDWVTRKFPGAEHNEAAWRGRVHIPLAFLLGARG